MKPTPDRRWKDSAKARECLLQALLSLDFSVFSCELPRHDARHQDLRPEDRGSAGGYACRRRVACRLHLLPEKPALCQRLRKPGGCARRQRGRAKAVAVTVDADDATLDGIVTAMSPDMLQLHGSETPERGGGTQSPIRPARHESAFHPRGCRSRSHRALSGRRRPVPLRRQAAQGRRTPPVATACRSTGVCSPPSVPASTTCCRAA